MQQCLHCLRKTFGCDFLGTSAGSPACADLLHRDVERDQERVKEAVALQINVPNTNATRSRDLRWTYQLSTSAVGSLPIPKRNDNEKYLILIPFRKVPKNSWTWFQEPELLTMHGRAASRRQGDLQRSPQAFQRPKSPQHHNLLHSGSTNATCICRTVCERRKSPDASKTP